MTRSTLFRLQAPLLALLLVAASGAAALAQDDAPAELEGELTFWHGLATEAEIFTNDILPAWDAAYPNVSVEVLQVPFDQLQNKYNTEASAGGGPDVLLGPSDWIGAYAEAEVILSLDDLLDEDARADFLQSSLDGMTFDGTLYGVPQRVETVALYYNKSLMPTPPTTTDELLQMAGGMTGPDQYGFGFISNFYHNAGYLYGFGGQIFDDAGELALDSPETVEFVNFLKSVKDAPGVFTQADVGAVESLFREGKAASIINGPWFLQAAEEAIGAENVGVVPLPAISANEDASPEPFLGVTGFYVNANLDDDQAELAAEFAKWLASDGMPPLVEQAGYLPANTTVETPADDPIAQAFGTQLESTVALPTDPQMGNVWTPAQDMITKVLEGQAPAEEAVAEAAETIEQSG